MKLVKSIFDENRVFYYITLIIWLSAAICGLFCAIYLSDASYQDITAYVKQTLEASPQHSEFIKLGIKGNLSFLMLITVFSSAPLFIPLTLALTAFKGFSAGFTSLIIIRIYALKGALVSLGAIVMPYVFSMPVIFVMVISSMRFSVRGTRKKSFESSRDHTGQWFSYISFQLILTAILCLITVAESVISKFLTGLVN